jgi:hypothetical protein
VVGGVLITLYSLAALNEAWRAANPRPGHEH